MIVNEFKLHATYCFTVHGQDNRYNTQDTSTPPSRSMSGELSAKRLLMSWALKNRCWKTPTDCNTLNTWLLCILSCFWLKICKSKIFWGVDAMKQSSLRWFQRRWLLDKLAENVKVYCSLLDHITSVSWDRAWNDCRSGWWCDVHEIVQLFYHLCWGWPQLAKVTF